MAAISILVLSLSAALVAGVAASPTDANACAPGYKPCLPVRGDLDCDQIADALKPVRVTGDDRYGLDRDGDGLGCDVAGQGGGIKSPWGVILQRPRGKEAKTAKVGDTLTVVGWSPRSMKGKRFLLCSPSGGQVSIVMCVDTRKVLTGTVQTLGTWKVMRSVPPERALKVSLAVRAKYRASDTVPLR